MNKIKLTISNLSKRYGNNLVLNGITLQTSSGKLVAVVGPNGSGKTTLLKCLCGLIQPSSGEISLIIGGKKMLPVEALPFIGAMLEGCEPYGELTVRENLSLALSLVAELRALSGIHLDCANPPHRSKLQTKLEQLISEFQLSRYAEDAAALLSTGMRQRLKLAMACAAEPVLLLLDEPLANMDEAGRALVLQVVAKARHRGATVFWATCDEGEARDAATIVRLGKTNHCFACEGFKD